MISDHLADVESVLKKISAAQERAARGFRPELPASDASPRRTPLLSPEEIELDREGFDRLLAELLGLRVLAERDM